MRYVEKISLPACEGLFAALNDCVYRNMNSADHLMLIDLDELVVPHVANLTTIPDLIRHLGSGRVKTKGGQRLKLPTPISSYSFQNAFFYLQFPDDETFKAGFIFERFRIS